MNKADFMREQLSDLSDSACIQMYDSLRKGHFADAGWVAGNECADSVIEHYKESMIREPDEVDRRINDEAA